MANDDKTINTDGGASVGNDVQTDGDFVGRDWTTININVINWRSLGAEFIVDLKKELQQCEQEKQKAQGELISIEKEKMQEEQKAQEKQKSQEGKRIQQNLEALEEQNSREKQNSLSRSISAIQNNIHRLTQRIIELEQKIPEVEPFDWSKAEQAYLDKLIKLYDRVRVLGNPVDMPLGKLFTHLYILDKPTARQRYDIDELREHSKERIDFQRQLGDRRHGMDLVKTNENLFILGKPGAGKTTFLKYITIQAAHKQLPRIPIFVSLNQWADSIWGKGDNAAMLPFIVDQFAICDFPNAELFIDYLLKAGRSIILFDGLDEVKQEREQRRRLTRLLQDFARKYDRSQHLITCRIAASDYTFEGFADVEVADFTTDQVREYVHKWFGENEKKFDAFTTELAKPENKGLAELCNTPLLLSMLCLTFDNNMRFPPNRAELYEDAIETLLRKWDSHREIQRDEIYRDLSYKRKLQLLMRIAVPTFEKGELFFRRRALERWIVDYLVTLPGAPLIDNLDGTVVLKAIEAQHGILIERAQDIYSFSHLTFQEYFTARYLAENQSRGVISKLIGNHLTDQRWREVVLMTSSLLDDANDFVNALRDGANDIIGHMPKVIYLLTWAHKRTRQANVPVEQWHAIQLAYIFLLQDPTHNLLRARLLALDLAQSQRHTRESALNLTQEIERNLALAQSLDRGRSLDLARSIAPDLALDLEHMHIIDIDKEIVNVRHLRNTIEKSSTYSFASVSRLSLVIARALANILTRVSIFERLLKLSRSTSSLVGFDYALHYAWVYAMVFSGRELDRMDKDWQSTAERFTQLLHDAVSLGKVAKLSTLAEHLGALPIPPPASSWQAWQRCADALLAILQDERDMGQQWEFNEEELNKLNDYFYTNELLVQCLKVAVVSDRQAILNSLLVPLKAESEKSP